MKHISILGKPSITIGNTLLECITKYIGDSKYSKVVVVSDYQLEKLGHVTTLLTSLATTTKLILNFNIPDGELFKTRETKEKIENFMMIHNCHRDTLVIAFGGGVVGDLVGFTASTYMRGVPVVQIPTTLLAMVDSSVGGKTGLDTDFGKNLIGAFHQPLHIFIDVCYLKTLPLRHLCNGMAEVVKTAAICHSKEFQYLEEHSDAILDCFLNKVDFNADLLQHIIEASVCVKADIVTRDEKEGGLRGLLNYGHTIGHAIEAAVFPDLLHGECVSLGMIIETEISRHLSHCTTTSLGRIERLLEAFHLPTDFFAKSTRSLFKSRNCSFKELLKFMLLDKKNTTTINMVLLKSIGSTLEQCASPVSQSVIQLFCCPAIKINPLPIDKLAKQYAINVPGSKSLSNRVLLLAALGKGTVKLYNLLCSEDTQVMLNCLKSLKACQFEYHDNYLEITGNGGQLSLPEQPLYISNAGTAARFLTTLLCLLNGDVELTGNNRMKKRPIHPLVDALNSAHCDIKYKEQTGFLPLVFHSSGLQGGLIELDASISSQYVSSILLSAPYAKSPITLKCPIDIISKQYIDMTIQLMSHFGVTVIVNQTSSHISYQIPLIVYTNPSTYTVEPDASSATYPLSISALFNTSIAVNHLSKATQGDAYFAEQILKPLGCQVDYTDKGVTSTHTTTKLKSLSSVDMTLLTDAFLTAAVLFPFSSSPTNITGISNQRVKECNRLQAMIKGLALFKINAEEMQDGLKIQNSSISTPTDPINCQEDHRVAMAFSLLGLLTGCTLNSRKCINKTYPEWFDTLVNVFNVKVEGIELDEPQLESVDKQKNIYLIGMRGVGKSTIATMNAPLLDMKTVDVDEMILLRIKPEFASLSDYIHKNGWEAFRAIEYECLSSTTKLTNTIVACGGGIIENEQSRQLLMSVECIWIKQLQMESILSKSLTSNNRPLYDTDPHTVYLKRFPLYQQCCTLIYISIDPLNFHLWYTSNQYDDLTCHGGSSFGQRLSNYNYNHFICMTLPSYLNQSLNDLSETCDGCNAIEIRLDYLECIRSGINVSSLDKLAVECQFMLQLQKPLILTLRTKNEGGLIDITNKEYMLCIYYLKKLNCTIDVEYYRINHLSLSEIQQLLSGANCIMSCHFNDEWDTMKYNSSQMQQFGLVKLIGQSNLPNSLQLLLEFNKWFNTHYSSPLISCLMGSTCMMSRALTKICPITHSFFQKAAPGQLTLIEVNKQRHQLGLISANRYCLIGNPINNSPSPKLHSKGYELLGLPHNYQLEPMDKLDTNWDRLKATYKGLSVTIPFKESIIQYCDELSIDAEAIGAVNTVIVEDSKVYGFNTDYIGILKCMQRLFKTKKCTKPVDILVIGAGGTSRAACYAANKYFTNGKLFIWNRTAEKAKELCSSFNGQVGDLNCHYTLIVSTIPSTVQSMTITGDYLIELSYNKENKPTKFMEQISNSCSGLDVLVEQGIAQFELMTNFVAPEHGMRALFKEIQ